MMMQLALEASCEVLLIVARRSHVTVHQSLRIVVSETLSRAILRGFVPVVENVTWPEWRHSVA